MSKRRQKREQCAICNGREFVDAIDNYGQRYRGCARCVIAATTARTTTDTP